MPVDTSTITAAKAGNASRRPRCSRHVWRTCSKSGARIKSCGRDEGVCGKVEAELAMYNCKGKNDTVDVQPATGHEESNRACTTCKCQSERCRPPAARVLGIAPARR